MPKHAQPFVEVEFDILFYGRAEEAATPTTALAMGDRPSHGSAGAEEEQIDVRIDLKVLVNNQTVAGCHHT